MTTKTEQIELAEFISSIDAQKNLILSSQSFKVAAPFFSISFFTSSYTVLTELNGCPLEFEWTLLV